jgi:hypothetical protein
LDILLIHRTCYSIYSLVFRTQELPDNKEIVQVVLEIVIYPENIEEHVNNMDIYPKKNVDIMVAAIEEMKNLNATDQVVLMKSKKEIMERDLDWEEEMVKVLPTKEILTMV